MLCFPNNKTRKKIKEETRQILRLNGLTLKTFFFLFFFCLFLKTSVPCWCCTVVLDNQVVVDSSTSTSLLLMPPPPPKKTARSTTEPDAIIKWMVPKSWLNLFCYNCSFLSNRVPNGFLLVFHYESPVKNTDVSWTVSFWKASKHFKTWP